LSQEYVAGLNEYILPCQKSFYIDKCFNIDNCFILFFFFLSERKNIFSLCHQVLALALYRAWLVVGEKIVPLLVYSFENSQIDQRLP
jgi:hypothetical protein